MLSIWRARPWMFSQDRDPHRERTLCCLALTACNKMSLYALDGGTGPCNSPARRNTCTGLLGHAARLHVTSKHNAYTDLRLNLRLNLPSKQAGAQPPELDTARCILSQGGRRSEPPTDREPRSQRKDVPRPSLSRNHQRWKPQLPLRTASHRAGGDNCSVAAAGARCKQHVIRKRRHSQQELPGVSTAITQLASTWQPNHNASTTVG